MKIKNLHLENFGKYSKVDVNFDPNVTYLIGPNGSSKTTIGLTAIWFILQGISEKASAGSSPIIGERFRFIKNNFSSAKGILILEDLKNQDEITITRKITKDRQEVKIESTKNGILDQKWLDDLFNVFMLSPKRFSLLSAKEQAKSLGLDTSDFDAKLKELKNEYTFINREIKAFGDLPAEPIVIDNPAQELIDRYQKDLADIAIVNDEVYKHNRRLDLYKRDRDTLKLTLERMDNEINEIDARIMELQMQRQTTEENIVKANFEFDKICDLISDFKEKEETDIEEIRTNLNDAIALKQDQAETEKINEKIIKRKEKEIELIKNKNKQDDCIAEKNEYLRCKNLKIKGLEINEDGELIYQGRYIKEPFFSTGEIIRIVLSLNARLDANKDGLKYVFIQDWDLLDEENQIKVQEHLLKSGYQVVIEHVGNKEIDNVNCIILNEKTDV